MGILDMLFRNKANNNQLETIINGGAFLVDVREPSEVAEGGVKGALNIPLGSIPQNLKKFANKEYIVVFCRSGNRSGQAKTILNQNGITNITNGGTWNTVNELVNNNKK